MNKLGLKIYLYFIYNLITTSIYKMLDLFPPLLRKFFFRLLIKRIGANTWIDYQTYIRYPFKVAVGSNTFINQGCKLYPSMHRKGIDIIIGDHVLVGPEVSFFSAGHDYSQLSLPIKTGTIKVHDYVWIGGRAIILPDVEIGEGAIIASGSVVSKSIPPYVVAAGNPARVIKNRCLSE